MRPPTALDHQTALDSTGLVTRYRGKSRLTDRGRACLRAYPRRHRVAEIPFLRLGLSPRATCKAAREVDLALPHRTEEGICAGEGHPPECPHGAPIPACSSRPGRN